jgi:hypothetical protein
MGKRPADVELFEGNMASIQWELRPSMQRDEPPTMETGLDQIAENSCDYSCLCPIRHCKLSQFL